MFSDEWWREFWESDEGKMLKAIGDYNSAMGIDTMYLLQLHYGKVATPVPDVFIKAFEGE